MSAVPCKLGSRAVRLPSGIRTGSGGLTDDTVDDSVDGVYAFRTKLSGQALCECSHSEFASRERRTLRGTFHGSRGRRKYEGRWVLEVGGIEKQWKARLSEMETSSSNQISEHLG